MSDSVFQFAHFLFISMNFGYLCFCFRFTPPLKVLFYNFTKNDIMKKYSAELLHNQAMEILKGMGSTNDDSKKVADILVAAELRGISSHGMIRLKDYFGLWKAGRLNATPDVKVIRETLGTALVDGDNSLGMISGIPAMNMAIEKAKNCGSGWVAVRNSNHYGIAGYYSMLALEHDMIGIAMTNANPLVAPTFSVSRLLGTNPIAVAIPAGEENDFIADFATTPIARGKLAVMEKKGEQAPLGYIQDKKGVPSTDPSIITQGGAILPLGSDREHGSHKGYCLGAIVDILSAVLSGANFGPFVPPQVSYLEPRDHYPGKGLGHFFGAIRVDAFQSADEFKSYMDMWIKTFKEAIPADGQERVYIPGEPERENEAIHKKEGITILDKVAEEIKMVCEENNIPYLL